MGKMTKALGSKVKKGGGTKSVVKATGGENMGTSFLAMRGKTARPAAAASPRHLKRRYPGRMV